MLSIVTITYADPSGLRSTLESLIGLEGVSWEHVIVDSSPDVNEKIVKALPTGWPLTHVVTPANGIYAAMNAGIAAAKGNVLWFLNGGDRLASQPELRSALSLLDRHPDVDMVACGVWLTRNGHRFAGEKGRCMPSANFELGSNPHQGMLYRRELFERVGRFNENYRIIGDYEHHWRCRLSGARRMISDQMLAEFDVDGLNATGHKIWREEMTRLNVWLRSNVSADIFAEHMRRDRIWTAMRLVNRVGSRVPRLRALLRPAWRLVFPRRILE